MIKKIIVLIGLVIFINCNSGILDVKSEQYKSKDLKVKTLKKHIAMFSKIIDTEYDIYNINGLNDGFSLPGPSSWDYKIIIKLDKKYLNLWLDGFKLSSNQKYDLSWGYDLITQKKEWKISSKPKIYFRPEYENQHSTYVLIAVFEKEGILFKRMFTQ